MRNSSSDPLPDSPCSTRQPTWRMSKLVNAARVIYTRHMPPLTLYARQLFPEPVRDLCRLPEAMPASFRGTGEVPARRVQRS